MYTQWLCKSWKPIQAAYVANRRNSIAHEFIAIRAILESISKAAAACITPRNPLNSNNYCWFTAKFPNLGCWAGKDFIGAMKSRKGNFNFAAIRFSLEIIKFSIHGSLRRQIEKPPTQQNRGDGRDGTFILTARQLPRTALNSLV